MSIMPFYSWCSGAAEIIQILFLLHHFQNVSEQNLVPALLHNICCDISDCLLLPNIMSTVDSRLPIYVSVSCP